MMDLNGLIERIRGVKRDEYEDDAAATFDHWEKLLENAQQVEAIVQAEVMQKFLEQVEGDAKMINQTLINKRDMEDLERLNLMDRRDFMLRFLALFDTNRTVDEIRKQIETL